MKYNLKKSIRDSKEIWKLECPKYKGWGALDDDQFHGRVSVACECHYHETVDFSKEIET